MIEEWSDPEDRLLARAVFGTGDLQAIGGMILGWAAAQGFGRASVTGIELSVGAAVTTTLNDGPQIFVKVWPATADAASLAAQMEVQAALSAGGFPAPALLTRLSALDLAGQSLWNTTGPAMRRTRGFRAFAAQWQPAWPNSSAELSHVAT